MKTRSLLIASASLAFLLVPVGSQLRAEAMQAPAKAPVEMKDRKLADEVIAKDLKGVFAADKNLNSAASGINVEVKDGVVTLSGNVTSERLKWEFGHKAKQTTGVRSVVNNIVVKAEPVK